MYNVLMETRNDSQLDSGDTVKVTCDCCYRKFDVGIFDLDDKTNVNHRYCSIQCALADLY